MPSTSSLLRLPTAPALPRTRRNALAPSCSLVPRRRTPSHLRNKYPPRPPAAPSPSPDPDRLDLTLDLPRLLSSLRLRSRVLLSSASSASRDILSSASDASRDLLSSASDASRDLLTSVSVDPHRRLRFSCRRSSLLFLRNFLLCGLAAACAMRALAWLWGRARSWGGMWGRGVVRRDRSLGGREVVVGRGSRSPLAPADLGSRRSAVAVKRREERVPEWWPPPVRTTAGEVDPAAQKEADLLVQDIMGGTMRGMDYKEDDIIQLRRICKTSGADVVFSTSNARDSFYRAAIKFVLNICTRTLISSDQIKIAGESVHQFVAGLAENIGLNSIRAAVILRAAVAAKVRSHFLQAWALDIQGKREEALEELLKICTILRIFPPDEQSPEIEMVAGGLEKNLRIEQRKHLFELFRRVSSSENINKTIAIALGLERHDRRQY